MESRNCHASYLDGGSDWPKVYNLSKIDMVLFAGKLTFEPESFHDVYSSCYQPVQVAIDWLTRQLDSLNEETRIQKRSSPRNIGFDQLVPPTLPLHMQGRTGVIEYEQIEKARLKRLSRWRREQKREKRVFGARKISSDESVHTLSTSSGSGSGSDSEKDSEPSRKRKRTPNLRYGSEFVCASSCKRTRKDVN